MAKRSIIIDPSLFGDTQPTPAVPAEPNPGRFLHPTHNGVMPGPPSTPSTVPTPVATNLENVSAPPAKDSPTSDQSNSSPTSTKPKPTPNKNKPPKAKPQPRKRKNMKKVTNKEIFTTFIDHGCTLDAEQYPLYPNGETVFVRLPNMNLTNLGIIGYTHTTTVTGALDDSEWKTTRVKCLGVMRCHTDDCDFRGPPPTGNGAIKALMAE